MAPCVRENGRELMGEEQREEIGVGEGEGKDGC